MLMKGVNKYAWQRFSAKVVFPKVGYYEVWARATDSDGNTQPVLLPGWNPTSYSKEQLEKYSSSRDRQRKQERSEDWNLVENGIHVKTGLKADKDLQIIIQACTSCHSAKLITQNRATREGWKNMIVWMQATQGLPDLGSREPVVLDYLARHYAPKEEGRRANLDIATIEWYILNLE